MLILNILFPLTFFFLLYLVIQIFKETIFFIYITQLKEYRADRLKAHFKTITGKKQIWSFLNIFSWKNFWRPKITVRSLLILGLSFFLEYNFFFFILRYIFHRFKELSGIILLILMAALFLVNLSIPVIVFTTSFFSSIIIYPFKKLIIYLASKKISKCKNLMVIGITGSYGKTAVKEILSFLLSNFFKTLKTPANGNTQLAIASLILGKHLSAYEIFVVEMGAYKRGEIADIAKMVKPKIGIITGINEQHLELFGSLDNTQWAKFELIKSLPKDGLAVFNATSVYIQRLYKLTKISKKLYGYKKMKFKTKLIGDWQQENIQACLPVADYLRIPREKFLAKLDKLPKISGGLTIKQGIKQTKIIDDSYNSNPAGFFMALRYLKKFRGYKKILISPGIIELGSASNSIHKKIGIFAKTVCSKIFLTKPDFMMAIKRGIGRNKRENFLELEVDGIELYEKLKPFLGKKTVILLEGRVPGYLLSKLENRLWLG